MKATYHIHTICGLCLMLQLIFCPNLLAADSPELRRLRAGMDLFPSFLAADTKIQDKTGPDGKLHIAIIYNDNRRHAEEQAERLQKQGSIKNLPLNVQVMRPAELDNCAVDLAGIFIVQPHLSQLPAVVRHGRAKSVITFSPFSGDVAQGVSGGISITARILPHVNLPTIRASHLNLKPFFLRIASLYE